MKRIGYARVNKNYHEYEDLLRQRKLLNSVGVEKIIEDTCAYDKLPFELTMLRDDEFEGADEIVISSFKTLCEKPNCKDIDLFLQKLAENNIKLMFAYDEGECFEIPFTKINFIRNIYAFTTIAMVFDDEAIKGRSVNTMTDNAVRWLISEYGPEAIRQEQYDILDEKYFSFV